MNDSGQVPIKVLLVDDHEIVQRDLRRFLETYFDIEVVGAVNNGSEAFEFCASVRPDVIVMDLVMPVMDGIQATRAILENDDSIRIIALTGSPDEEKGIEALQAGALVCLHKNHWVVQQLHAVIVEACGRSS